MLRIPAELCVKCKFHKRLCRLPRCPLLERFRALIDAIVRIDSRIAEGSTPPSTVVGEHGYPHVRVYLGIPPNIWGDNASIYENPEIWWGRYGLLDILKFRASMIYASMKFDIRSPFELYEKEISIAAIAERPTDAEAYLRKLPKPRLKFSDLAPPLGPAATAEQIKIVENPKISPVIEKYVWDDVRAEEAVVELYRSGVPIYTIQRALSLGLLGKLRNRKLVSTRWAITAVDTIIAKDLLKRVKELNSVNESEVHFIEYLGNRFWIIITPGPYRFELLEIWHPITVFTQTASAPIIVHDYESLIRKPRYMNGGFYAARLAVLEYLNSIRKSASVIVIREVTPRYYASVGNWHIRESIRQALIGRRSKYLRNVSVREVVEFVGSSSRVASTALKRLLSMRGRVRALDEYFKS